jgi:hypothetical protein
MKSDAHRGSSYPNIHLSIMFLHKKSRPQGRLFSLGRFRLVAVVTWLEWPLGIHTDVGRLIVTQRREVHTILLQV